MPISNVDDQKNVQAALELLAIQLENEKKSLNWNFKRVVLKLHPDKNPGNDDARVQFQIINSLREVFDKYLEKGGPTKAAKNDMAYTLKQLPTDLRDKLVDKFISENPSIKKNELLNPVNYRVSNHYVGNASNPLEGRYHALEVNANNFNDLKEQFREIKGDYLKTQILKDFQAKIENTSSKEELDELKQQIKGSSEYKVLATGQGIFTRVTGIKTSSVKELESMFDEQESNLSSPSKKTD